MAKTWLSVATALFLAAVSAVLFLGRWYVLGDEIEGPPGSSTWRVSLVLEGELTGKDALLTTLLPPDFRRQHMSEETFQSSKGLTHRVRKGKEAGPRRAVWQR